MDPWDRIESTEGNKSDSYRASVFKKRSHGNSAADRKSFLVGILNIGIPKK